MSRKSKPSRSRPTDGELGILRVLWQSGPTTVRHVHEQLGGHGEGYTTTLKLMQIMHQKGLVSRDESERAHVYTAAVAKDDTQQQLLGDLMQRVFDGSRESLVLQALGSGSATREELDRIRALLDELEKKT